MCYVQAWGRRALSRLGGGALEAGTGTWELLERTAQRRNGFRTAESPDLLRYLRDKAGREGNKVGMNYLGVEKFQGRQSFGITPMLLEVALEGGRGSGRRRKRRARDKQAGDGVQGVHIRREGNLM